MKYIQLIQALLAASKKSKTMKFNGVMGTLAAVLPVAQDLAPALMAVIPGNVYGYFTAVLAIGNIILRTQTDTALLDK